MTTREYLDQVLQLLQVDAKKSLGQNFLISDHVVNKITVAVKKNQIDHLIEIGPGPGALTRHLFEGDYQLTLIELDRMFSKYWKDKLEGNVGTYQKVLIEIDALRADWDSIILKGKNNFLVSNLPYQISSSILIDRSIDENPLMGMALMFQKEVAQRIKSSSKDSNYGMLSVVAQTFWKIETLLEASSGDFSPAPKVASRVLTFERKESPIIDKKRYLKFVKQCFVHPRRMMIGNLQEGHLVKDQLLQAFKELEISEKTRPQELKVIQFEKLYFKLYSS